MSLVIHIKYILYICATIEIYIYAKHNGSQLIGWRESFEFHPRNWSPEIFFDPTSESINVNIFDRRPISYFLKNLFEFIESNEFYTSAFDSP